MPGAERSTMPTPSWPGMNGGVRLDRPLAAGGVDVGVAEAAGLDADEHLLGPGLGDRHVLDLERPVEAVDDGGLHVRSSFCRR